MWLQFILWLDVGAWLDQRGCYPAQRKKDDLQRRVDTRTVTRKGGPVPPGPNQRSQKGSKTNVPAMEAGCHTTGPDSSRPCVPSWSLSSA